MDSHTTLSGLVEALGFDVVGVETAPAGLDVPIGDPVIHDRLSGNTLAPGDVVLAVGVDPLGLEFGDLLTEAGRAGAAAIVVKFRSGTDLTPVVAAADRTGVALLRLSRDVEWGHLHALARMITSTGTGSDDGDVRLGDLFALANAIAMRANAPVTIEDAQSRVLAYSTGDEEIDEYRRNTILGRRVPQSWVRRLQGDGVFQQIQQGTGPVRISYSSSEPGYRDRLVVAVRAGGEVLGTIWIQEATEPLGPAHEALLTEVSPLAALHLVRHFAGDMERRQEAELMRAVLSGRVPSSSLTGLLEVRSGHQLAILGIRPECADDLEASMHIRRLSSVMALVRRTEQLQLLHTSIGSTLYVMVLSGGRLDAILGDLATRAHDSVAVPLRVVLARSPHGLDRLPEVRSEVDDILSVCDVADGCVTELADVLGAVSLLRVRRLVAAHPELAISRVQRLVASDSTKDTNYVATLQSYLDHFGDVVRASAAVDVHPNTFRYRLRRAVETAGLDLDDPVERLMAHLHLKLLDGSDDRPSQDT